MWPAHGPCPWHGGQQSRQVCSEVWLLQGQRLERVLGGAPGKLSRLIFLEDRIENKEEKSTSNFTPSS